MTLDPGEGGDAQWVPLGVRARRVDGPDKGVIRIGITLTDVADPGWIGLFDEAPLTRSGPLAFVTAPRPRVTGSRMVMWEVPEGSLEHALPALKTLIDHANAQYPALLERRAASADEGSPATQSTEELKSQLDAFQF